MSLETKWPTDISQSEFDLSFLLICTKCTGNASEKGLEARTNAVSDIELNSDEVGFLLVCPKMRKMK
jgi:hypothetical protein